MYLFTCSLPLVQSRAGCALRRLARRFDIDTSDDSGFTTVEKVVLTGIGVAVAIAVGAIVLGKARRAAEEIDPTFDLGG